MFAFASLLRGLDPWKTSRPAGTPVAASPAAERVVGAGGAPAAAGQLFLGQFDDVLPEVVAAKKFAAEDKTLMSLEAGKKAGTAGEHYLTGEASHKDWTQDSWKLATDGSATYESRVGDPHEYSKTAFKSGPAGQTFTQEDAFKDAAGLAHKSTTTFGKEAGFFTAGHQSSVVDAPGRGKQNESFKIAGGVGDKGVKGELAYSQGKDRDERGISGKFDSSTGTGELGFSAGGASTSVGVGASGGPVIKQSFKMFGEQPDDPKKATPYKSFGVSMDPDAGSYVVSAGDSKHGTLSAGILDDGFMVAAGNAKGGGGLSFRDNDEMTSIGAQAAIGEKFSANASVTVGEDVLSVAAGAKVGKYGAGMSITDVEDRVTSSISGDTIETSRTDAFDGSGEITVPFVTAGGGGGHSDTLRRRTKLPEGFDKLPPAVQAHFKKLHEITAKLGSDELEDVNVASLGDGEGISYDHEGHESVKLEAGADAIVVSGKLAVSHQHLAATGVDVDRTGDRLDVGQRELDRTTDSAEVALGAGFLGGFSVKEEHVREQGEALGWATSGPEGTAAVQRYLETGLVPGADQQDGWLSGVVADDFRELDGNVRGLEAMVRAQPEGDPLGLVEATLPALEELRRARRERAEALSAVYLAGKGVGEELAPGVTMTRRDERLLRKDGSSGEASFLFWDTEWKDEDETERTSSETLGADGKVRRSEGFRERHDDLDGAAEQLHVAIGDAEDGPAMSFTTRERHEDDAQKIGPLHAAGFAEDPSRHDGVVETTVSLSRADAAAAAQALNEGPGGQAHWLALSGRALAGLVDLEEGVDLGKLVATTGPEAFGKLSPKEQEAWVKGVARSSRLSGAGSVFDAMAAVGGVDAATQQRLLATLVETARSTKVLPPEMEEAIQGAGPAGMFVEMGASLALGDQPEQADLGREWADFLNAHPELEMLRGATKQRLASESVLDQIGKNVDQLEIAYDLALFDFQRVHTLQAAYEGGGAEKVLAVLQQSGETAESLWNRIGGNGGEIFPVINMLDGTSMGSELREMFKEDRPTGR